MNQSHAEIEGLLLRAFRTMRDLQEEGRLPENVHMTFHLDGSGCFQSTRRDEDRLIREEFAVIGAGGLWVNQPGETHPFICTCHPAKRCPKGPSRPDDGVVLTGQDNPGAENGRAEVDDAGAG